MARLQNKKKPPPSAALNELREIERACPVCDWKEAAPFLVKGELRLVGCARCGMIYANPAPAQMASGKYYDEEAGYYLSPDKLESDYAESRFERELRLFRRHCVSGAVLDVGCSSGAFLFQLRTRFPCAYEVLGTDVSGPALDYAESRGTPVLRGEFLTQDFAGKTFDAVTFWAVLEHLASPRAFLEKASSVLKPGGLCFILVPNMSSLAVRLLGGRYRYIYPQHLNYFTLATLRHLTRGSFTEIDARFMHFNPVVIWKDWRSGGAEVSNPERAQLLQRTTSLKQNPLLAPVRWGYAMAERALGAACMADNLAMVLRKA